MKLLLVFSLLFSPYLILLCSSVSALSNLQLPNNAMSVFVFTATQSFISATATLIFGVLASFGLLGLRALTSDSPKINNFLNFFILLPGVVPVLIVILACLNLAPGLSGFLGIVLTHTLMNLGIVAVSFESQIREQAGPYVELARVEGASRLKIIFGVIFAVLRKELTLLWLTVFALCFSSFAIPLIIGGSRATTVEVLIYELIRIDSNWSQALMVALCQAVTIIILTLLVFQNKIFSLPRRTRLDFLALKPLSMIAFLPSVLLVVGLCSGLIGGASQLFTDIGASALFEVALNSLLISLATAALALLSLILIAAANPTGFWRKILIGYVAPSALLTGLALLLIWRETGLASLIKIIIGLTLIFVPILYRLSWDAKLSALQGQIQSARVLGARNWQTLSKILWPQLAPTAARLAALASFWAWGEFALTKMVSERTLTVSLLVQSLMSSYRLNSATALVWLMLIGSAISYFFVWGLINVTNRKSFN